MTPRASHVSVVDPIGPAIEQVKLVLFRPFDMGRWFVIGFCAWLANLARGGGGGGNGHMPGRSGNLPADVREGIEHARVWIVDNLYWIGPVAIGVGIAVIGVILLLIWLRSRGQFMFLYCVAQNKAEVTNPWRLFRRHGNSLFAFRVVFGIVATLIISVFIGVGTAAFLAARAHSEFTVASLFAIVACSVLAVTAGLFAAIVAKFTKDFVVPLMYLHTASAIQGWRILLDIISFNKARFFVYLLFQIVIAMAVMGIVVAAICLTCCCACCILAIPYVGTVFYLPVLVFLQAYPLHYLAQYGPQFNAFVPVPQAVPPAVGPMPQQP